VTRATKGRKSESSFSRWLCGQLEAAGAETQAFVGSATQGAGIPDRYVCHREFRGWLEMKKDDRRVTLAQRTFLRRFAKRGDVCLVVRYRGAEVMETEDAEGRSLGWLDLVPLYCLKTDRERGQRLLEELARARKRTETRHEGDTRSHSFLTESVHCATKYDPTGHSGSLSHRPGVPS